MQEKHLWMLFQIVNHWTLSSGWISSSSRPISIRQGYGEWVALWWCLSSYGLLFWTEYDPWILEQDFIFFIEDIWIHYERMEAYLRALKMQSYFHNCKGIVVGSIQFSSYLNHLEWDECIYTAIKKIFNDSTFPIISVSDIGHVVENRIIPIWGRCILDNSCKSWYISFPEYSPNEK
jgi:muramoyltetrapeptide carboxypeptidase LdcA involved in peptidoglycan recycling